MCSSGAWAFSSGRPKPIKTQGTLKVSCICVTKGMDPPSRMKTAFLPKPFSKAACALLKIESWYGATHGLPVLKTSNVLLDKFGDLVRILVRYEARREFSKGLGRNDGLGAFALIAAPYAVQFECRARPKPLDGGKALFAEIARCADSLLKIFFLPGKGIESFPFGLRNLRDRIVETWHGDTEIPVVKFREQLRQDRERIGNGAAINAGMQIALRAGQFDLIVVQAAQAVSNGGNALAEHGSIGDNESVGLELFLVMLNKIPEADAADFLFAFDQNFHVNRKPAVHFLERFERFEMDVDLAFIIGSTASKEVTVADGRFEGRRGPKIERLGGLHVIVAIKEDGGLARSFQGFGIDERVQICRNDFNGLKSCGPEVVCDPARTAFDIRLVLALGADTGNAQKFTELRQMLVALTIDKLSKIHKRPSGDMSPFEY